jgi:hypothetical protein
MARRGDRGCLDDWIAGALIAPPILALALRVRDDLCAARRRTVASLAATVLI